MVREVRSHKHWWGGGCFNKFFIFTMQYLLNSCQLLFMFCEYSLGMLPLDYLILFCLVTQSCLTLCGVMDCQSPHPWNFCYFFILNYETEVCLLPSRMSFEIMVGKYLLRWELTWVFAYNECFWLCLSNLGALN